MKLPTRILDRPPHGVVADGGVVLDWRNSPRSAVDAGLDSAASPIPAEPASAGSLLHARRGLHLPSSPASIIAQRIGEILPSSYP